jgi:hypothetical protein
VILRRITSQSVNGVIRDWFLSLSPFTHKVVAEVRTTPIDTAKHDYVRRTAYPVLTRSSYFPMQYWTLSMD